MALLLAVLQALALVILEQPVLAAEVARAEAAVAHDTLCGVLAVLETTPDLLGWHTSAHGQGHVECAVGCDVVFREGCGGGGEVLAGVHEAQVGLWEVCP